MFVDSTYSIAVQNEELVLVKRTGCANFCTVAFRISVIGELGIRNEELVLVKRTGRAFFCTVAFRISVKGL